MATVRISMAEALVRFVRENRIERNNKSCPKTARLDALAAMLLSPLRPDLGSGRVAVTGTAAMRLVDAGLLSLEVPGDPMGRAWRLADQLRQ